MDTSTLNKLVGNLDKKELIKIIGILVNSSEYAEQKLLDYCQKNLSGENRNLIIEKQLQQHWKKAVPIILMANMYGGCPEDEEEEVYDEMSVMADLLDQNENISWQVRKEVLDEMLDQIAEDNSGFTDYMVDVAVKLCKIKEEKVYLADFMSMHGNSYYKDFASRIYREAGENQKYLDSRKLHLHYGSDYLDLANYYEEHGQSDLSLKTVIQGLNKAEGRLDEIYDYLFKNYKHKKDEKSILDLYHTALKKNLNIDFMTELMYDFFKEKQDYPMQKEMLLKLIQCADQKAVKKWYLRCQSELSRQDYIDNENTILQNIKKKNLSVYFDICMEKGKWEEVLDHLKQHPYFGDWQRIDDKHRYSIVLANKYPQDIIALYWREVNYFVGLGKDKNYRQAVSILREIHQIMKKNSWTEEWEKKYFIFLEEHRRKRLLMKELEKF